jgi:hypothetical protein
VDLNHNCVQITHVVAGFGSLCIVPQLLFSFLLSEALMGMAFPLFVLMACESDPRAQYQKGKAAARPLSRHVVAVCTVM